MNLVADLVDRLRGLADVARRASARAWVIAGLLGVAIVSLLVVHTASDGGSAARDTQGGLVGRLSPACAHRLAGLDRSVLDASGATGIPSAAETAGIQLASETASTCLEDISDWSLAVAHLERRLVPAALRAGRTPPTVTCESPADWAQLGSVASRDTDGYVEEATMVNHLSPLTCLDLARLVRHPGNLACVASPFGQRCPPSLATEAFAVVVLAHEQQHVDGDDNEPLAQCYAYQHARDVSHQLGVPSRVAARVAAFVYRTEALPFAYQSTECRHGGSFDLRLREPWPLPS